MKKIALFVVDPLDIPPGQREFRKTYLESLSEAIKTARERGWLIVWLSYSYEKKVLKGLKIREKLAYRELRKIKYELRFDYDTAGRFLDYKPDYIKKLRQLETVIVIGSELKYCWANVIRELMKASKKLRKKLRFVIPLKAVWKGKPSKDYLMTIEEIVAIFEDYKNFQIIKVSELNRLR